MKKLKKILQLNNLIYAIVGILIYENPQLIFLIPLIIKFLNIKIKFFKPLIILTIFYIWVNLYSVITIEHFPTEVIDTNVIIESNLKQEANYISFETFYKKQKVQVIYFNENIEPLHYGQEIKITGVIQPITSKYYNSASFSSENFYYNQKIVNQIQVTNLEVIGNKKWLPIKNLRLEAINFIESHFPKTVSGYMTALIFGDKTDFNETVYESYQNIGVVHLLVISGMHLSLIIGSCYFIISQLTSNAKLKYVLIIIITLIYMALVGFNIPILRAGIMVILYFVNKIMNNPFQRLELFTLMGFLFILVNPLVVYQVGFQLSLIMTLIILLTHEYQPHHYFKKLLTISIITCLVSMPIIINLNYTYNFLAPFSNLIFIPIITLIVMPLIFIIYILSFIIMPDLLINFLENIIMSLEMIAAKLNYFTYHIGHVKVSTTLIYYVIIYFWLIQWQITNQIINKFAKWLFLIIMLIFINFNVIGQVNILDVGQGDAILIQLPFNQADILIDTGGDSIFGGNDYSINDLSSEIVQNLAYYGISQIDYLLITHGDNDHSGEAIEIMSKIPVNHIILGNKDEYTKAESEIINFAHHNKIKILFVSEGDILQINQYKMNFVWPKKEQKLSANDSSIVMNIELGNKKWLFTGDIERGVENYLVAHHNMESDILKVAHHGSNTSTDEKFLNAVNPQYAIISSGRGNRYNHPTPETIAKLNKHNIEILNTQNMGEIKYLFMKRWGLFVII